MIESTPEQKHYTSARERFLEPMLGDYLHRELQYFGPDLSKILAQRIVSLLDALCPDLDHLKPGQVLWNALDKNTRGDSSNRRLVPVVLTLVAEEDIEDLRQGVSATKIRTQSMARMFHEAIAQGGILSTRDAGLLLHIDYRFASKIRCDYEAETGTHLPHPGVLQDMGSTLTHKAMIVRKVVIDKKDPATVARETRHTQQAVDRYLKQYRRVATLFSIGGDAKLVEEITGMSKRLVAEYVKLLEEFTDAETA